MLRDVSLLFAFPLWTNLALMNFSPWYLVAPVAWPSVRSTMVAVRAAKAAASSFIVDSSREGGLFVVRHYRQAFSAIPSPTTKSDFTNLLLNINKGPPANVYNVWLYVLYPVRILKNESILFCTCTQAYSFPQFFIMYDQEFKFIYQLFS